MRCPDSSFEALSILGGGRKETLKQKKKSKKTASKKIQTQTKPNRKQLGGWGLVLIEDVYNIYGL